MVEPVAHKVRGADGLTLNVLEWSREGPALLLLHGFGHSARVWDACVPDLTPQYRVLALDARGHGDSDHDPKYRYHHASVARDLESVLDNLEIERAALVAHSMGGYATIRFAAHHAHRVSKLVLVDAGAELSMQSRAGAAREPADPCYADAAEYAVALARSHPRTPSETLERLARHWLRSRNDGRLVPKLDPAFLRPKGSRDAANRRDFDRADWAREETERLWRYLAKIPCPTLVVRGEHSPMLSADTVARMVGEVLPDARSVAIADASHTPMLDNSRAFRAALAEFLIASG